MYETISLPTFPGFAFQFYLLLLSLWKREKNQDLPILTVVLPKKEDSYRFQFLGQSNSSSDLSNLLKKKERERYFVDSCLDVFQMWPTVTSWVGG